MTQPTADGDGESKCNKRNEGGTMMQRNKVIVHPLVLLSVVDHYHRVDGTRVVGVILGYKQKVKNSNSEYQTEIHITNSFAVPFDEEYNSNWFIDTSYLENMFELFFKVNGKEKILGWYHSGPDLFSNDLQITQSFLRYVEDPYLVIVDVKSTTKGIPVRVYELEDDNFKHIFASIEAEEAEEVGVEHLIRDIKDDTYTPHFESYKDIKDSLNVYSNNLQAIINELDNIINNNSPMNESLIFSFKECLSSVLKVSNSTKINELSNYVGSVTKTFILTNDLIRNRKEK
ncbi:26S proteasome regulatory complex, subunit RPN8/PSMD7 [Trachipleistophora hominis]|uniref:26S proteasome regulatory complex, subunit RPN8/PSMD7 n=1 Tax=Trachipleistophora hominis TaxID=72359 RepID=L7JXG0_TRAHO|nr:26S proteasome regulatory complex, subunit RPN8/PSMD7 [Trachipleistophora hominis]